MYIYESLSSIKGRQVQISDFFLEQKGKIFFIAMQFKTTMTINVN